MTNQTRSYNAPTCPHCGRYEPEDYEMDYDDADRHVDVFCYTCDREYTTTLELVAVYVSKPKEEDDQ